MIRHPLAYLMALTIVSTKLRVDDMEQAAYQTLIQIGDQQDWSDEYRSELYARIADGLPSGKEGAGFRFDVLIDVVSNSLWHMERTWPR